MEKAPQGAVEVLQAKEIERYEPVQYRKLGSAALDGFAMMPEAININESIREKLEGRVIGQPAAIEAIIEAMDRREARLASDNKPIANFAFLGPTGVVRQRLQKLLLRLWPMRVKNLI